jgi:DNA-binding CsgD family transcriptional regulator/tetratricopeptide (TPR) repeat protein
VERLAGSSPVVVAVEDVHWADPSSRELLDFLVRGLRLGTRLLLVATLRTDALDAADPVRAWVAELARLPVVERIDLGPLPRADVASLIADVLRRAPEPAFVERVMERANGNPFLVEELAALGDGPDVPLPEHLRDILLGRLAGMDPATRDVLRAAAAGGRSIDDGLVADVLGMGLGRTAAALRDAVGRGVLVVDASTGELRFRHPLLRDSVEGELFPAERQRLHLAYASALEGRSAADGDRRPEELAFHWDAAGRPDRAAPALLDGARAAAHMYAWVESGRAFDRALALEAQVPGVIPAADLPEVLLDAGNAWAMQGAYERAVALTRRAVGLVDAAADAERAAHAHDRLRWCLWEAGDIDGAADELEEALRLTPPTPPSALRAEVLVETSILALWRADASTALRLADEGTAMARLVGSPSQEGIGLGAAGLALAALGDVDGAVARLREAMALARRLEAAEGLAIGSTNLTAILDRAGRTAEALEAAEAGFAEVQRYGLARTFGVPLLVAAARMRFHQGRWEEAATLLEQARSLVPLPAALATVELLAARLAAVQGRFEDADLAIEAAIGASLAAGPLAGARRVPVGLGVTAGLSSGPGPMLHARIELAAWRGDLEEARRVEDEALPHPIWDQGAEPSLAWVAAVALRIEADAAVAGSVGRDEVGRERTHHRIAAIARWLEAGLGALGGDLGRASAVDPRVGILGRQCVAEGERAERRSDPLAWAAVAVGWERLGRPLLVAYARFREGEAALLSPGGRDAARDALRTSARLASGLGAAPLLECVERLARLARIDLAATETLPSAPADEGPAGGARASDATAAALGLTPRELQVLRLVAEGWSNPEIGEELGISPRTASVHVSNVLAKLGVPNRVEAAVAAMQLGLVERLPGGSETADASAAVVPRPA